MEKWVKWSFSESFSQEILRWKIYTSQKFRSQSFKIREEHERYFYEYHFTWKPGVAVDLWEIDFCLMSIRVDIKIIKIIFFFFRKTWEKILGKKKGKNFRETFFLKKFVQNLSFYIFFFYQKILLAQITNWCQISLLFFLLFEFQFFYLRGSTGNPVDPLWRFPRGPRHHWKTYLEEWKTYRT